jgi:peptidyl-prolyl cis-trans isomerase SurA
MSKPLRRGALLAAAALALPLLASAAALAQSRAPASAPPSRIKAPKVELPPELAPPPPESAAAAVAGVLPQAPAAQPPAPQMAEGVAALVNDEIISSYDLSQRMRLLVATSGIQPTDENLPQLEQEALRSLIDQRLETQEIDRISKKQKTKDFVADDKDVDEQITGMAQQANMNYAQLKQAFAASNIDIQGLREQIRTTITWQTLVRGMYGRNIRIGDDQVSSALARLSAQASQTQYLLGEIFLSSNRQGGMDQTIQLASQLITQMNQGAPFAKVASQLSAAPTAANGGDTGWITAAEVQPEVARALEQMRPGQLSQPIPVSDGIYIVYLRDKQAASGQTMVSLKQAAVRLEKDASQAQIDGARAELVALKPQLKGCDNIDQIAGKTKDVRTADLGEADINELSPQFKEAAEKLQPGQVSDPIRTEVGLHLVAICAKHAGGSKMPSRVDIQNRLEAEQLQVMARRYLRDLRNSATIESR